MSKTPEELYEEREKRVLDAIALRKPDRVPLLFFFNFFPPKYVGSTPREVMYEPEKTMEAYFRTLVELEPDMDQNPFGHRFLGPLLDALDYKQLLWPGHGMSPDHSYQFVEGEYMKAEEYDHFLLDPSDFIMRKYWPRVAGGLRGFGMLPPLHNIISYYMGMPTGFAAFGSPQMLETLDVLRNVGEKTLQKISYAQQYGKKVKEAGFPMQFGGLSQAPFDTLGDFLRGTKGLMLDMYRRPEKVIKACERLLPFMLEMAVDDARATGNPRVFIPLHKGLDGFMSLDQFLRFFWPTLRELMVALIDKGLVPCPFWEGDCTSRLEIIKNIPAGKACYNFEATDIFKAKEVLGDTVCIRGNVPLSVLATGTPDEVRAYCKKLIDIVGDGGGYILDASTSLDDAKPENVKAMVEFSKEYGVY